jgi:hypothetical protein
MWGMMPYYALVIAPRDLIADASGFEAKWYSLGWKRHLHPLALLLVVGALTYNFYFRAPQEGPECVGVCTNQSLTLQVIYGSATMLLAAASLALLLGWVKAARKLHLNHA